MARHFRFRFSDRDHKVAPQTWKDGCLPLGVVIRNGCFNKDGTLRKRFPFMQLPQVLREEIILLSLPRCQSEVDLSAASWDPKKDDPDFVPALAKQGNEELRLECILLALQNVVVKVTSKDEAIKLRVWLAGIDFSTMKQGPKDPLKNGFDVVRGLLFSDTNRVPIHDTFERSRIRHYWKRPTLEPSYPASDLELARMCKSLRTLSIDMSVTKKFVTTLNLVGSMTEALKSNGFGEYKIKDLLGLKGLKLLKLCLYTKHWVGPELGAHELGVIATWLSEELKKRGNTVDVVVWCGRKHEGEIQNG